ncbi:hypothetical protein O9G_004349 [Rozella allomycis CSF55]|uniref:Uncharacterized protein n=1 Tax=Rozella allomycis (strain CSF55) TaxID=988480 RepID=A0A075AXX2_ROZAC|nr:hypothetical protein O9G_004349 [Rozella allomycis CSF55]|eukprot:EPZ34999.1 hypothetical protein O9G_004349 [Rozella allomycis CSF55]
MSLNIIETIIGKIMLKTYSHANPHSDRKSRKSFTKDQIGQDYDYYNQFYYGSNGDFDITKYYKKKKEVINEDDVIDEYQMPNNNDDYAVSTTEFVDYYYKYLNKL